MRSAAGKASASRRKGRGRALRPMPRAATSGAAPRSDHERRGDRPARPHRGDRLSRSPAASKRLAIECLDEQFAMAAGHRRGDRSIARRTDGQQGERRHPGKRNAPADRHAMRGGDPDAQPGEAAGTAADEDLGGRCARREARSIIGISRSAWPRPMISSRASINAPSSANSAALQLAVEVSIARIIACPAG